MTDKAFVVEVSYMMYLAFCTSLPL